MPRELRADSGPGSPEAAEPVNPASRRIGAHYDVAEELGRGGMARVYRVIDARSGEELALKQLIPQPEPKRARESAVLFEREFHTLAQLAHPRVIEVYDYGVDRAAPYYTMELLDGGDLRERSPLPWREACEFIFDVCSSLALLHSRRMVHRDVSPRNVRCTRDGHAKLIDFGAMVPMGANAQVVGTPPFVAPEALHCSTLDARTDLFSLGNTLYFALTGRLAYPARSFANLVEAWAVKPAPPSAFVPDVPPVLDRLVMSMIGLEAALRPRSAFEVMQRLTAVAGIERSEPLSVSQAYLTTPTLVARSEPLAKLQDYLVRAAHGRGRGILLTAPPGLGRSRMLDAISLEAKMAGACVLRAGAEGGEVQYFAVGRTLAEQLLQSIPDVAVAAAHAAEVFDSLFESPAANDATPRLRSFDRAEADRIALQGALLKWFLQVTKQRVLLIAVDDTGQVDDGSIALLAALAQRARGHSLVVLASAEQALGAQLPASLEVLSSRCAQLSLRPLEQQETEQLLGSVFGDVPNLALLALRIHALAAGNPREVMGVAQHLVDRQVIRYDGGSWSLPEQLTAADMPASVEDAIRGRTASLGQLARRLAETQALSQQDTFSREEFVILAGEDGARELDDALNELVTHQVLTSDGLRYSLRDRVLVRVLCEGLDEPARRQRFRALARLNEESERHIFATARFWLLAGENERGLDAMLSFVRGIKDRVEFLDAARIGVDEAGRTLALALDAALEERRPARDCHALRKWLAMISVASDERLYWLAAPDWLAQLERDSGLVDYRQLGHIEDKGQRLMRAFQDAAERHRAAPEAERVYPPDEAIRFLVHYVAISIAIGARTLDAALLMTLPELLEPFAPISPLVAAIWQNALATRESSCYRQTERARARWIEVYEKLGQVPAQDPQLVTSIRFAIAFGVGLGEATIGLKSANDWADLLDKDLLQRVNAMYLRKIARLQQGDLEGAERCRKHAELLALQSSVRQMFTNLITLEIGVHAAAWDLTGVKQIALRIEPHAERHRGWRPFKHLAEGHYRRLLGDLPAALEAYGRCLELATPDPNDPGRSIIAWPPAVAGRAEVLIALERAAEARQALAEALAEGERREMVSAMYDVRRALALAEAKLGQHVEAAARLDQLIGEQREAGVSGLILGASYESRTRVAIWAGDQLAVEAFSKLTAEQYRHGHGSPLGARYERLMEEARGAGVHVLPSLTPFETTIFGSTEYSSRFTASAIVNSAMLGAGDRRARAERALSLLCDAHRASGGHLYLASESELRLAASRGGSPDDILQRLVSDFWSQQVDGMDAETEMMSDGANATPLWSDRTGKSYRPFVLHGRLEGRAMPAGVVLVAGESAAPADAATEMPLLTELASYFLRSGDSAR